jgi:hypothetical protein
MIALRNPDLQVRELNYAVQMTIDRIVFLRICEDRGIERENQLQELLEGEQVYERLCQVFCRAVINLERTHRPPQIVIALSFWLFPMKRRGGDRANRANTLIQQTDAQALVN